MFQKLYVCKLILRACVVAAVCSQAMSQETIYQVRSLYQDISVVQTDSVRCLQFADRSRTVGTSQGCLYLDSRNLALPYSEAILAGLLVNREPRRVLVLGLGAGVVPLALRTLEPEAYIEVVEIDPVVVDVARAYFLYKDEDDPMLRTYTADGRRFIREAKEQGIKYDLVILDAFTEDYIPPHMMTVEFLLDVQAILNPNAVLVANTFSRSRLYDHESATYYSVFGDFYSMKLRGDNGNRILVTASPTLPDVEVIRDNARFWAVPILLAFGLNVNDLLQMMEDQKDWDTKARLLTDQYSPVNLLNGQSSYSTPLFTQIAQFFEKLDKENPILAAILVVSSTLCLIFATVVILKKLAIANLFNIRKKP